MKPSALVAQVLDLYGWTQAQLAHCLKVNTSTVWRWSTGAAPPTGLSREVLEALARAGAKLPKERRELAAMALGEGIGGWIGSALLYRPTIDRPFTCSRAARR